MVELGGAGRVVLWLLANRYGLQRLTRSEENSQSL